MTEKPEFPRAIIDNGAELPDRAERDETDVADVSDAEEADREESTADRDYPGSREYLEIIVADLGRPFDNDGSPDALLRALMEYLRNVIEGDKSNLTSELTLLGTTVIGRFRIPMVQWIDRPGTSRAAQYAKGPFVHLVTELKVKFGLAAEVTGRWLEPDRGLRSLEEVEGGIPFKPGSISFLGDNRPIPAVIPDRVLETIYRDQWVWSTSRKPTKTVTVGLFDTGIDDDVAAYNPLIAGALARDPLEGTHDAEMPSEDGVVDDVYGHGAFAAGIVVQRCPEAKIDIETVRSGRNRTSDSFELARDVQDLDHCDIVVFPLAVPTDSFADLPALRRVIQYLLERNKVVVAAAGLKAEDDPPDQLYYPADIAFDKSVRGTIPGLLIRVGAVDANGNGLHGNRVPGTKLYAKPDTRAETNSYGYEVASAYPNGLLQVGFHTPPIFYGSGCARWTGTSFAAPRVAGAVADRYLHPQPGDPEFVSVVQAAEAVIKDAADSGGFVS